MADNKRVTLVHESGYEESVPADDKVEINQRLARGFTLKGEPKRAAATPAVPTGKDAK